MAETNAGQRVSVLESPSENLHDTGLREIARSKEPVVKIDSESGFGRETAIVYPVGKSTLVLAKNAKEIQILDEKGKRVEGVNTSTMIVDWPGMRKSDRKEFTHLTSNPKVIKNNTNKEHKYREPNDFPQLKDFLDSYIKGQVSGDTIRMPEKQWKIETGDLSSVKIVKRPGWILIESPFDPKSVNYVVFTNPAAQEETSDPTHWKRYDTRNTWLEPPEDDKNFEKAMGSVNNGLEAFEYSKNYSAMVKSGQFSARGSSIFDEAIFLDRDVGKVGNNLCRDPINSEVMYYCDGESPEEIRFIFPAKKPTQYGWDFKMEKGNSIKPGGYKRVENLRIDPSGEYFCFQTEQGFVILKKDTMEEMLKMRSLRQATLDDEGKIRGVDEKGHFVVYDVSFSELLQALKTREATQALKSAASGLFKQPGSTPKQETEHQDLIPQRNDFEIQFTTQLAVTSKLEDIFAISEKLRTLRTRLQSNFPPDQIEFLTVEIENSIQAKQKEIAMPLVTQGLTDVSEKLSGDLDPAVLAEASNDLVSLRSLGNLVDDDTRARINKLGNQLAQETENFYRKKSPEIETNVSNILEGARFNLQQMTSMSKHDDWEEYEYPKLVNQLEMYINNWPAGAPIDTYQEILKARRELQELAATYRNKFKTEYAEIRQQASVLIEERTLLLKSDIQAAIDRLQAREFNNRQQAETYINTSEALQFLRDQIEAFKQQNPDEAERLEFDLKVQIANFKSEIERRGNTMISETGQQMEPFGNTLFPIWEAKVKETTEKRVDLIFIPNQKSEGPEIPPDKIYGDIGLTVINSRGKMEKIRLYEGWEKEDEVRLGISPLIQPSYVTHAEFEKIRKLYIDWKKGEKSIIRKDLGQKSQELRQWRKDRMGNQRTPQENEEWSKLLNDYVSFYAENHISILNRVDRIKKAPETEYENGKGFVEDWQSNWVRDNITERYLEEMAQISKMQLDQQSGILTIRGNPGAGKDVLVSMFSNKTNRPYFAIDCTRWDTPYEFSEDIVLESKDGASQTVHVPSTVLNGITTPGAIVYLNEIHALTYPTQIFLHALADAKRRVTLKTSSGRVIKALDSVVLMASMNRQDKDPIEPALRDRMVFMDVDYPPLYREKDPADKNPNPPIDASEALRIAREVKSLRDFTIEPNMDRNEFVRMWDKYINGIDNGAGNLSKVQEFDMNVILATVQFANKLRENFVAFKSGRTQIASKALPVSLPATGRPLRDCAYSLSSIPDEQKVAGNPEGIAKTLLERWFLRKIDNIEDREKIKTAMATWTSSKRPAA